MEETKEAARLHKRMARGMSDMQKMFLDAIDFNKLVDVIDQPRLFGRDREGRK